MTLAVPFVDMASVHSLVRDELRQAFDQVLDDGAFVGSEAVSLFEADLARTVGAAYAVGVASGTAALHLTLTAAGIRPGDEVILPANTYFATAEAVFAAGARPVLVDVDEDTALATPEAVEAAITPRTAAIVMVHLYGQPADAGKIAAVAARHGLFLLEDAAQAIGAAWDGTHVGSLGDAAAFSFYPSKNLGALGDGGAVTTSDPALARRVSLLRSHGEEPRYVHRIVGFNERLDTLQASFLMVKLAHLDRDQADRDSAVHRYRRRLAGVPAVRFLGCRPEARHVHHLFVVRVPDRDDVVRSLRDAGIGAQVHYPVPIHLQPACPDLGQPGEFPATEALAASIVSLPLYPRIENWQVDCVAGALAAALRDKEAS